MSIRAPSSVVKLEGKANDAKNWENVNNNTISLSRLGN